MVRVRLFFALLLLASCWGLCAPADCSRTSTGLVPLPELGPALYKGVPGGLYPGGSNARPAAHEAAGLRLASEVVPRNALGLPDSQSGRIVLLSIGMSNTTMEFQAFLQKLARDPDRNPQFMAVDGAQGGQAANVTTSPSAPYWTYVDQQIAKANVTAAQIQVIWLKQADIQPTKTFPDDARQLQSELVTIAQLLRSKFPNLKLLYLSSRIYGGYANTALNPEPYAYQGGFAMKWLIEQQINGDPALSYDKGTAPWMAWGPYLWADGLRLRADGLSYACSDLAADGTHPADSARARVADLLLNFFKSDTTARSWFVKTSVPAPPVPQPKALVNGASFDFTLAPRALVSLFGTELAPSVAQAQGLPLPPVLNGVSVDIGGVVCPLLYVSPLQINLIVPPGLAGGDLRVRRAALISEALPVALLEQAPAVFTLAPGPAGPAAARHVDGTLVSDAAPAARAETIELYVTGLGALDYVAWQAASPPRVLIAGREATVAWAGPAPGFPGLDQINVTIPPDSPAGSHALELRAGTLISQAASIWVK